MRKAFFEFEAEIYLAMFAAVMVAFVADVFG
jgi:hypothetical protein